MTDVQREVTEYAAAVRRSLADVPTREREELLEDLEEHLAEVAAEPGGPLAERLGPPEAYAVQLWSAYSERSGRARRRPGRRVLAAATALVVAAALLATGLAWRSAHSSPGGAPWSAGQLLAQARAGHVSRVDVTGGSAVATSKDGSQHAVRLPADTSRVTAELTQDGVDVAFNEPGGMPFNVHWGFVLVLLVELALAVLVVLALVAGVARIVRRTAARP